MKSNRTLYGSLAIALMVLALLGGKVVKDVMRTPEESARRQARGEPGTVGAEERPGAPAAPDVADLVLRGAPATGATAEGSAVATGGYWDPSRGAVRFRFAGEVFDATSGHPVTSFELRVAPSARPGSGLVNDVSHPEGHFLVDGLAAGAWDVTVRAAGYAPSRQTVVLSAVTDDPYVVFPLSAGSRLTGTVVDWRNEPVEGAEVKVSQGGTATTDAKGAFVLKSAPEDTPFTLSAAHPRYGSAMVPDLRVDEGETKHVKVTLSGILRVTGVVHRGAERTPIAGVIVKSGEASTLTNERGAYEIFIPLDDHPMVRVITGDPPVELESYPDNRSAEPIRWVTAKTHVAELAKDFFIAMETGRLVGRIMEANGGPVAGARVLISNTMGWAKRAHQTFPAETITNGDGRYRVDNLPAHAGYRLRLARDGEERLLGTVTLDEPAEVEANFVLAGHTLRGRFVDSTSRNPLPLTVRDCDSVGATRIGEGAIHLPKCFEDGTFEIPALAEGRYRIHGVGTKVRDLEVHEVEVDVPTRDGPVDVRVEGQAMRTWTARVTDKDNTFVAGCMLRYQTGKSLNTSSLETADDGTTRFTVPVAQASIFIEAPGYAPTEVKIADRDPRVLLAVRLERSGVR